MTDEEQCDQWWHGGLTWGIFHRCDRKMKHTGYHSNKAASLKWTGKLTEAERELLPA